MSDLFGCGGDGMIASNRAACGIAALLSLGVTGYTFYPRFVARSATFSAAKIALERAATCKQTTLPIVQGQKVGDDFAYGEYACHLATGGTAQVSTVIDGNGRKYKGLGWLRSAPPEQLQKEMAKRATEK